MDNAGRPGTRHGTLHPVITAVVILLITYVFIGLRQVPHVHVDRPAGALVGAVLMVAAGVLVPAGEARTAQSGEREADVGPRHGLTVTVTPGSPGRLDRVYRVVLLCETEEEQRKGLQGFRPLRRDEAALFTYLFPVDITFWMGSVAFPIDIIFVAPDQTVRRVQRDCRPGQTDLFPSNGPVRWVIETAAGSGVRAGDRVRFGGAGSSVGGPAGK